jgi:phosphate butyryltransferase
MLHKLTELQVLIKDLPIQRLVVAMANDDHVIEAVELARKKQAIKPILIGPSDAIKHLLQVHQYPLDEYILIDAMSAEEAAMKAVEMIKNKKADLLMKGLLDTKVLLKMVVNKETGIRDEGLLSHVAVFSFPKLNRLLFATDCAMVINPSVDEKETMINNVLKLTNTLGYTQPKVGIVSAVEKVNPKIPSTVEAMELVERFKDRDDVLVDGPFALDNLVSMASVHHKDLKSRVAGKADVLVFPNLEAGNIFYKTSVFLADAEVCGLIIGAKCPIILTSRADDVTAKLNSILLAKVYHYGKTNSSH